MQNFTRTDKTEPVIGKRVGAAASTLAIIRHLCHAGAPLRLVEIADPLGLNRSTVLNILRTLVEERFLAFDARAKAYGLTDEIGRLADAAGFGSHAGEYRLQSELDRLAARFHVNLGYWAIAGDRLVLELVAESPSEVRVTQSSGQRVPLLQGAVGRVVAAASNFSDEDIARRFKATRFRTPQRLEDLLAAVHAARERGWSDDGGTSAPGTVAIAVPLVSPGGTVRGACAALMMAGQYGADDRAEIARELMAVTAELG